jgi:hypothetical protein
MRPENSYLASSAEIKALKSRTRTKKQSYGHEHDVLLQLGEDLSGVSFGLRMNGLVKESQQDLPKSQQTSLPESADTSPDDG